LIDEKILNYLSKLFNVPNNEELRKLVSNYKIDGGLELILPGMYFDAMKFYQ